MPFDKNKWIAFAELWNDHERFPTVEDLREHLGLKTANAVRQRAKAYRSYGVRFPDLMLPPIIDRSKILDGGFELVDFEVVVEKSATPDKNKKRFVISSAQYGAEVNEEFLASLKTYCDYNDAQLLVLPLRYRTPSEPISDTLSDFMTYSGHVLHKHIEINTAPILATATNPLQGMHKFTAKRTQIFPHPQIAFETVGRTDIHTPKAIMTTGAVTYPNYGHNKASEIASMFHSFGAVVIELDGDMFHFRHIEADVDGNFHDYAGGVPRYYTADGVSDASVDSLVCGDWHTGETCPKTALTTYHEIVPSFKPENIFKHDFFNGHSVSHHDERCETTMMMKEREGLNDLKMELDTCSWELSLIRSKADGAKIHIVASNHNDHLDRYISEGRYKKDIRNKEECMRLSLAKLDEGKGAFELAMLQRGHDDVVFLQRNEECVRHGIELAMHGDVGINGAKGSAVSFKNIGFKCTVGHAHSPSIKGGCHTVGTSTPLRLGYTRGLTGWLNTHSVLYNNGQRQMINIINGKWHG